MQKRRLLKLAAVLRDEAGRRMFKLPSWGYRRGTYHEKWVGGSTRWKFLPESLDLDRAFRGGGACGTTACLAGMAAATSKGWKVKWNGPAAKVSFGGRWGVHAFQKWAGISLEDAEALCLPDAPLWNNARGQPSARQAAGVIERFVKTGKLRGPR